MAKIDFRESELHVVGCDRNVATRDHGESAAKNPAIDTRDDRLRHFTQDLIAPLARFFPHLVTHAFRLRIHLDKILLQILPRAETLTGSGYDDHPRILVVTQVVQTIIHLAVKLRAHRVAFLGTIQRNRRHPVFLVN